MPAQRDTGDSDVRAWVRWLAVSGFILALVVYGVCAVDSPMVDPGRRAQLALLTRLAGSGKRDEVRERILAEAYWSRYADVADDRYFGRNGVLGIWGARAHYDRHGRREGRIWGAQR